MLHVEVFAEKAWAKIQRLAGADFFDALAVDASAVRVGERRLLDVFGADLSPEGLHAFWSDRARDRPEKLWLRKLVVAQVSEWSDRVDWLKTLAAVDGAGIARDAVRAVLPFLWLDEAMAAHIGLDVRAWRGVVEHFHPLQFLMWLQLRARRRFVSS